MSVLEFLGKILPWPRSKRWDDIQICKSRLVLQADALHAAAGDDPLERTLAFACDRGAAEWEQTLLKGAYDSLKEQELTAHSALSLAQRAGDWLLVGSLLQTWRALGATHKRFYRDAAKAYERAWPSFERTLKEVQRLGGELAERPNAKDAQRLLGLTQSYADCGGSWVTLHARANAYQELGENLLSLRTGFAACVANPHEWRLTWTWLTRAGMLLEPKDLPSPGEAEERALAWYDQSGLVQAAALFLANKRQTEKELPPEVLLASTMALRDSIVNDAAVVFAYENIAWALMSRGRLAQANEILSEAIRRVPANRELQELREELARWPSSASMSQISDIFARRARSAARRQAQHEARALAIAA